MKVTTWNREDGFVSVVLFANNTSAAVSTKTFKTKKGAEGANKRIIELCGENWEKGNLPWKTTNPKTGEVVTNFHNENLSRI
jgi:hypothetical protein|tara:strand:- start:5417 stop:5662 length:246 start_codon:yes stop_codon:yes gene_type:complete